MRRWHANVAIAIAPSMLVAVLLGFGLQQLVDLTLPHLGIPSQEAPASQQNVWSMPGIPRRIAITLRALDSTPSAQRPAEIAVAKRPGFRIRLLSQPINNPNYHAGPNDEQLQQRIQALLTTPHKVIVTDEDGPAARLPDGSTNPPQKDLLVEAALSDGQWVAFERRIWPAPGISVVGPDEFGIGLAAGVVLSAVVAILLSFLAAWRIVKPLGEVTASIEQLGGSGDSSSLRPRGPREIESLMLAFNRMQDRLRRFNGDRTRMFASMSHDLRTPLTRLRVRLEMIEDLVDQKKMLADLDATNEMIESILLFARDDTQQEPRTLVDLSALVEGICEDASDGGEPVTFHGPRAVTIACRPEALRRAVSNLVDNAIKYGKIALVTLSPAPDHVLLTVEDEGPGVPWAEREKVFEPFYRSGDARDPNTGGVGLGLSVARSIVREHGGDITLANRKGGGLSVRLKLPVAPLERVRAVLRAHRASNRHRPSA